MARAARIVCIVLSATAWLSLATPDCAGATGAVFLSHSPVRPLPTARTMPLAPGPNRFVDPARGDDRNAGSEAAPWKTLAQAFPQLRPGQTLYLRGGTYYEKVSLIRSGGEQARITIAGYPGELAVIDGGLRAFVEQPAACWEPYPGGAEGEFVSTSSFPQADARRAPTQFVSAAWEPMWGIEEQRPLALGNFVDSMLPLHGYRRVEDLRAANEFWPGGKDGSRDAPVYCGPGLWFDRDTGRIHVRLARHRLSGLGDRAYRGQTDPRKLPLTVALGFGDEVLRVTGIRHVTIRDIVFRGATGSPMIHVYGSEDVELDHVSVFGGFPGLLVNASKRVCVRHSAFRGLAAPWTSRAHMKYRGTASYQVILQNNDPLNEDIEFAWCEFTDGHDFAFLRFAKGLRFHHNFVDNFNDDGLECGPKLREQAICIYQNHIGRCLIPLTQHDLANDEPPIDPDPASGLFVFRNIFDLRGGTYKAPPDGTDPSGAYLHVEGHVASAHGGPVWPLMRVYQNTFLRHTPVFRDGFLFGLGTQGLRNTERDVFNNLFVQTDHVPGGGFKAIKQAEKLREGGNLLWGMKEGPSVKGDWFAAFRASKLYAESRNRSPDGWTTHDSVADPRFVALPPDESLVANLRLRADSPAIGAGQSLPQQWPDPLRAAGAAPPDIGALPYGTEPWDVGVDGRRSLFAGGNTCDVPKETRP